ncbi:MAG: twin-arginine translocase subunit TatC [Deltaproteobacteria bacterium]|nr:twin-arginine translocase subunit TatC [Deltaproteobacteria bacterium]
MAKPDERLPFTLHLVELRKRLINCVIAVGIGFGIAYFYSKEAFDFMSRPLIDAMPQGNAFMVFTGVIEPFFTYLKIALICGIFLASPVIFYQIWLFISPGLYEKERSWALPIVMSATILFIGGATFGYYIVFPVGFKYFLSYATDSLKPMLSMNEYFSFVAKFLLAFGIVFEMPLLIFFLAKIGIVDVKMLTQYRKYAVLLIFVVAAILTPTPDAFSQLLMAAPMLVLYEVGIILARLFGKKKVEE